MQADKKNCFKMLSIGYFCLNERESLGYTHTVFLQILFKKAKKGSENLCLIVLQD